MLPITELVMKKPCWLPLVMAAQPTMSPCISIIQAALLLPPSVPISIIIGFDEALVHKNACMSVIGIWAAPTIQPMSLIP